MTMQLTTEQDLVSLIGQYESLRLEFKSSRLLEPTKPKQEIIEQLAREVSAFANTEGGIIVIGVETGKEGGKAMASAVDEGVDPDQRKPEWLQQVVASNISPPLNGLVVRPVPLTGARAGRVAYVIEVPKGVTAHQSACDLKYYGRNELEIRPLQDSTIRLLMHRGTCAHAKVTMTVFPKLAADEYQARQKVLALLKERANPELPSFRPMPRGDKLRELEAPMRDFHEYEVWFEVENDGPVTIQDACLAVSVSAQAEAAFRPEARDGSYVFHWRPAYRERIESTVGGMSRERVPNRDDKLFPGQSCAFPDAKIRVLVPTSAVLGVACFKWTLFLENAPPVSGTDGFSLAAAIDTKPEV